MKTDDSFPTTPASPAGKVADPLGLVCPSCQAGFLTEPSGRWRCVGCASKFGRESNGFPDLVVGERFDDPSSEALLRYEEDSNADLTRQYFIPTFRKLWPGAKAAPRLLSVGCGTGVDVDLLHEAGFDSVGIDCGNRSQVWPRRQQKARLALANGKHLPFENNSFDAAFCGCVFPHVGVVGDSNITAPDVDAQRAALAREMVRVLRPGGYVVVSSPNRKFLFDIFHGREAGSLKPRWNPPSSRFLLSLKDYEDIFGAAGCSRASALPPENYWGFIRSKHSLKGLLAGMPVRFVFWLVSRPAFAGLRDSPLNPWLVVLLQKEAR
jgi:SAM-dependent methyltransferase